MLMLASGIVNVLQLLPRKLHVPHFTKKLDTFSIDMLNGVDTKLPEVIIRFYHAGFNQNEKREEWR